MTIDPSEIGRHPDLIKKAQTEMAQSDVLVCGKCHEVFHFMDLFKEHKDNNCKQISTLKDCRETKPKVWAFLLWKASQLNVDENSNVNAWKLYQTWIKLEESVRETWLVAGRTIQSFARFGNGTMQEMPVKITRTVVESEKKVITPTQQNFAKRVLPASVPKPAVTGIIKREPIKREDSMMDAEEELSKIKDNQVIRKVEPAKPALAKPTILANKVLHRSAIRTLASGNETEERDIEKILAKRYNPRKKGHEYLIKWSNLTQESNTWEPLKHIEDCKDLLDIFETQLAKQKEQRAKMQDSSSTNASTVKTATTTPSIVTSTPNRPIRFSKAKAIDQVKQWVTSSHHHEKASVNTSSEKKRKYDDSDYDVVDEEEDSDFDKRKNKSDPIVKRVKTDNVAVNEALMKAGSTGNVRIMAMNKGGAVSAGTTVGATTVKKIITKSSSDVIITNDQKKSGVFKKTVVPSVQAKVGEAQVKIINKSDAMASGIVRISAPGSTPGQGVTKTVTRIVSKASPTLVQATQPKPIVRTVQTTITTKGGTPVQKQVVQRVVQKPGQTPSPNVRIVQKQVGQTPAARVQQMSLQNRSSMSPKPVGQGVTTVTPGSGTIRRVTVPAKPSPQPTITKKIIQASPQTGGVTRVVRKVVTSGGIVRRKPADEEDEIADPFPKDIPTTNAPPSPPRPLTLCPITGEVLGKAEGEKSPDLNAEESAKPATAPPGKAIIRGKPNDKSAAAKKAAAAAAAKESEAQDESQTDQQQIHQFLANEDGSPIYITGEDGTIYQVAGKNANGETILISQDSNGEQQCVLLSADQDLLGLSGIQTEEGQAADGSALTVDAAVAEAVALGDQLKEDTDSQEASSDATQPLSVTVSGDGDSQDGQITAEIVQADMPSPGGTRKVVLLLPDGSLMMTDVSDEQFQSLNIQNQE